LPTISSMYFHKNCISSTKRAIANVTANGPIKDFNTCLCNAFICGKDTLKTKNSVFRYLISQLKGEFILLSDYKMINNKKIVVVLPAYNAEQTLAQTYAEIPFDIVDDVVLVDDASNDKTVEEGKRLGIKHILKHEKNRGYGGNQKTCYNKALELGADIIIMLHPDYQYTPKLIPAMANIIAQDLYPVVLGSRILGNGALKGGMPIYKYIFNRFLTFSENVLVKQKLSEYHTGYRAYTRNVLETIPYELCSDDFVFDNQVLSQIIYAGFEIAEVTCPTKYFKEASSINFSRSMTYGMGVMKTSFIHFFNRIGLAHSSLYNMRKKV
jgi:glycosyltransferase involved in cell wall biosynthesis